MCPDVACFRMHPENGFEALFVGVKLGPVAHGEILIVLHPVRQPAEREMLEVSGPPHDLLGHSLRDLDALLGGPLDNVHPALGGPPDYLHPVLRPPLDDVHSPQSRALGHVHPPVRYTRHPGGK